MDEERWLSSAIATSWPLTSLMSANIGSAIFPFLSPSLRLWFVLKLRLVEKTREEIKNKGEDRKDFLLFYFYWDKKKNEGTKKLICINLLLCYFYFLCWDKNKNEDRKFNFFMNLLLWSYNIRKNFLFIFGWEVISLLIYRRNSFFFFF